MMVQNVVQNVDTRRTRAIRTSLSVLSKYGLLILAGILVILFSLLRRNSFPTLFNLRTMLGQGSVTLIVALGLMVPFAAGVFDLSIGYWLGCSAMLVIGLQVNQGWPWGLALIAVLVCGVLVGVVNGLLVTVFKVDSLIATLGMGSVIYGITLAYSGNAQIIGKLPVGFVKLTSPGPLTLPWSAWLTFVVCIVLWVMLSYLRVGRRIYVVGANPRAAELAGISIRSIVLLSFTISGVLGAVAGILLASSSQLGQPGVGPEYLLPGFTAAFLGTAAIRPGRLNTWGTVSAVGLLAIVLSGLLQLGVPQYAQNVFNGGMLIVAMAVTGLGARRRVGNATSDAG